MELFLQIRSTLSQHRLLYTSSLQTIASCDSLITTTVKVNSVSASVTKTGFTLTANNPGATYQWLKCNSGFIPVAGATGQNFVPSSDGNYAVVVTLNGCKDTSSCFLSPVGLLEWSGSLQGISVYPVPAKNVLFIETGKSEEGTIELIEVSGAPVRSTHFSGSRCMLDLNGLAEGLYWLRIDTKEGNVIKQIIKKDN